MMTTVHTSRIPGNPSCWWATSRERAEELAHAYCKRMGWIYVGLEPLTTGLSRYFRYRI